MSNAAEPRNSTVIQTAMRSQVAKNAYSLYAIQFVNYILPLVTVPYLVRVLGPQGYGIVAFGQSLTVYGAVFMDYGFNLSAARSISVNRGDPLAVGRIACSVWAAKVLLAGAGLGALVLFTATVPKLAAIRTLLLILYGGAVGNALLPVWLFLGMERMFAMAVVNVLARALLVVGIFVLVRQPEDYLLYATLMSVSSCLAGVAGTAVGLLTAPFRLVFPSWPDMVRTLREGWMLFLSTAAVNLYVGGNGLILGLFTGPTAVGYYAAAEKIVRGVVGIFGPLVQAAYPRFAKIASHSKGRAFLWGRRMLWGMGATGLVCSLLLFLAAPAIVRVGLGAHFEPSIPVMRILAALPFLIAVSFVLGPELLVAFGKDRAFAAILWIAYFVNLGGALALVPIWEQAGMATAVLACELFVTVAMFVYLRRAGLNPFQKPADAGAH